LLIAKWCVGGRENWRRLLMVGCAALELAEAHAAAAQASLRPWRLWLVINTVV